MGVKAKYIYIWHIYTHTRWHLRALVKEKPEKVKELHGGGRRRNRADSSLIKALGVKGESLPRCPLIK